MAPRYRSLSKTLPVRRIFFFFFFLRFLLNCGCGGVATGSDSYDALRPHSYKECNVAIVFFSLVSTTTLEHVRSKWVPEVRKYGRGCPIILVGTFLDMRSRMQPHVTSLRGNEIAGMIGACKYVEMCAMSPQSASGLFAESARVAVRGMTRAKRESVPHKSLPLQGSRAPPIPSSTLHGPLDVSAPSLSSPRSQASPSAAGIAKAAVTALSATAPSSSRPVAAGEGSSSGGVPTTPRSPVSPLAAALALSLSLSLSAPNMPHSPPAPPPPSVPAPSPPGSLVPKRAPPPPPPSVPKPPIHVKPPLPNRPAPTMTLPLPLPPLPPPPPPVPKEHSPTSLSPIPVPASKNEVPLLSSKDIPPPVTSPPVISLPVAPFPASSPSVTSPPAASPSIVAAPQQPRVVVSAEIGSVVLSSSLPDQAAKPTPAAAATASSGTAEDLEKELDIVVATPRLPPVFDADQPPELEVASSGQPSPPQQLAATAPVPIPAPASPGSSAQSGTSPPKPLAQVAASGPMPASFGDRSKLPFHREASAPMLAKSASGRIAGTIGTSPPKGTEASEAPAALQTSKTGSVGGAAAASIPRDISSPAIMELAGEERLPQPGGRPRPPTVIFSPGEVQSHLQSNVENVMPRGRTQKTLFGVWIYREIPLIPLAAANWGPSSEFYFLRIKTTQGKCVVTFLTEKSKKVWQTEVGQGALLAVQDSTRFFVLKLESPIGLGFYTREESGAFVLEFMKKMYEARNFKGRRRIFAWKKQPPPGQPPQQPKKSFIASVPMPAPAVHRTAGDGIQSPSATKRPPQKPGDIGPPVPSQSSFGLQPSSSSPIPGVAPLPAPLLAQVAAPSTSQSPAPSTSASPHPQPQPQSQPSSQPQPSPQPQPQPPEVPEENEDYDVYHALEDKFILALERAESEKERRGVVMQILRAFFRRRPDKSTLVKKGIIADDGIPTVSPRRPATQTTATGAAGAAPLSLSFVATANSKVADTPEAKKMREELMKQDEEATRKTITEARKRVEEKRNREATLAKQDFEKDEEFKKTAILEARKRIEEAKKAAEKKKLPQKPPPPPPSQEEEEDDLSSSSEEEDQLKEDVEAEGGTSKTDAEKQRRKHGIVKCMICNEREVDRVVVPCGHASFCGSCIQKWTDSGNDSCPTCKTKIGGIFNFQH